jgi:hypothetical protein
LTGWRGYQSALNKADGLQASPSGTSHYDTRERSHGISAVVVGVCFGVVIFAAPIAWWLAMRAGEASMAQVFVP